LHPRPTKVGRGRGVRGNFPPPPHPNPLPLCRGRGDFCDGFVVKRSARLKAQKKKPPAWPDDIYAVFKDVGIKQVAYVPDAGHTRLINRCHADRSMKVISLTTEEEGVAMLAGTWLGGERGVLLLQSSGVGNCINLLSIMHECRFPLLMIVTMR